MVPRAMKPVGAFLKLLSFWGDVYHSHSCERRFLEFSSGIPFEQWLRVEETSPLTNCALRSLSRGLRSHARRQRNLATFAINADELASSKVGHV